MLLNSEDFYRYCDDLGNVLMRVPFEVGRLVELKDNPTGVFKITQYRIVEPGYSIEIYAGLTIDIYSDEEVDFEISISELSEKWKATDLSNFNNLNPSRFHPDCKTYEQLIAKHKSLKK